jgi:GLPGLI family protein
MILPLLSAFIYNNYPKTNIDYSALYQFTYTKDSLGVDYAQPEEYILYRTGSESRFLNYKAYYNDSISYAFIEEMGAKVNTPESTQLFFETKASKLKKYISDLRTLKDFKKKTATIILYNTSKRHYLIEPLGLNWKMVKGEIDTIAGIQCYKATTQYGGRTYIAWYSPQIPINDGPYIFHGLPGLITKVEDSQKWYKFELKELNTKPKRNYSTPPFIEKSFQQQINRVTYVERSKKEKLNPIYKTYYKKVTPEILAALREKRKSRFDLIIEKQ